VVLESTQYAFVRWPYPEWGEALMKNGMDSTAVGRAPEPEAFANRKLIRPSLNRDSLHESSAVERRERSERFAAGVTAGKKTPPPEQTHAENFYYQKQMQTKTPMVVVTTDGEELHGIIEWYDKSCIKLNRATGQSNLLIYKSCIKYMFKEGELNGRK
jgi:host factor-I protein